LVHHDEPAVVGIEAVKGGDAASMKSAADKLNEAWQSVSAELYRDASEKARAGAQQSGQAPPGGGERKQGDEVVEAEVVDEEHKHAA